MQNADVEPTSCPDCGHLVYRPLLAPVRHPQDACRAIASDGISVRCGCSNAAHRTPSLKPRHRLEAGVAS